MHRRLFPSTLAAATALGVALSLTSAGQGVAQNTTEGPKVGQWKTWHLASAEEIEVPAPPAEGSEQTKAELNELRLLQGLRGPALNRIIDSWNGVPATQRWSNLARAVPANGPRFSRLTAYVTTAMFDAVVVAYRAKYAYNRKAPAQLAPELTSAVVTTGEPSYPSEHAAIAGAGAAMLAYFHPAEAKSYESLAQEAVSTRLVAGTNYRSDIEAGLAIGRAVAAKAIERAESDGSDAKWTGTVPTGEGLWLGTSPVEPLAGTWRTWNLTSGSQIRPGPPPVFGSPEFQRELAEVKRITTALTAYERAQAQFWIQSGGGPIWEMAHALMTRTGASPARAARISALMATSLADAFIACWDTKYLYWSIRPTQVDPTIPTFTPVPAYPAYSSGFSANVGAVSEALALVFPEEAGRIREMGYQAAIHRLYDGLHYRVDIEVGLKQGRQAAEIAFQRDRANDN